MALQLVDGEYRAIVDKLFFMRYDELAQEIHTKLADAERDEEAARQQLHAASHQEVEAKIERVGNEEAIARLRSRINYCETSCFWGTTAFQPQTWCSGGVAAKIERLKNELAQLELAVSGLVQTGEALEKVVAEAHAELDQAHRVRARKDALVSKALGLFDAAVATQPSPPLERLQKVAATCEHAVQFERANSVLLQEALTLCRSARGHYYAALRALQAARATTEKQKDNGVCVCERKRVCLARRTRCLPRCVPPSSYACAPRRLCAQRQRRVRTRRPCSGAAGGRTHERRACMCCSQSSTLTALTRYSASGAPSC
jgi:hypothetical protein